MSDQPTPETDALISVGLENADSECVPAEFARKLERERDEARKQIEVCRGIIERTVIARNSALSDLTELERERDEARAVASELSDIASKHLSFLLAITPTKPNEKHEKDTEKVINALKRWKKL